MAPVQTSLSALMTDRRAEPIYHSMGKFYATRQQVTQCLVFCPNQASCLPAYVLNGFPIVRQVFQGAGAGHGSRPEPGNKDQDGRT